MALFLFRGVLLACLGLFLFSSNAFAARTLECNMPKAADISVVPKTQPVQVDTSQSQRQLQAAQMDTINPYGFDSKSYTNGYMKGTISMRPVVKLGQMTWPALGAVCMWYDTVSIEIWLNPKIVIASEVARDKCMSKAVLFHEMKHVKVDREVVNKYAQTMGQKVYDGLKQRGFLVGPVKAEYGPEIVKRMQDTVVQLLELEYKKLEIEREELQQGVDSLEEYQRVQAECPDFKPSF